MRLRHKFSLLAALSLVVACAHQPSDTVASKAAPLARVAVAGGELEYRAVGQGEPVLLIHGSIFADAFEPLLAQPALSQYRLIAYHRRGFAGSSRAQPPFTIPQQAADALALLDRLGIQRAHVVGHSYGGAIALQLAAAHPDRVATLSLLEPAFFAQTPATQELFSIVGEATQLHAQGDSRAAIIRFVNGVNGRDVWEEMAAQGATAMQEQAVADAATFFEVELPAMPEWRFTFDDVAKLRVPTLAVLGEMSNAVHHETHATLRRILPESEELRVSEAGHELQMSQPRLIAEGIAAFLARHRM